jgi:hypothetical protein
VFVAAGGAWCRPAPTAGPLAVLRMAEPGAPYRAHAVHVLDVANGSIAAITCFLDAELVPRSSRRDSAT